jgi:hypothetical protein
MLQKYNEEWFATPERVRERAKSSLTASSAIASVLGFGTLVAGIAGNFANETALTFVLIVLTFLMWVLAALASIFVLAGNVSDAPGSPKPGAHMAIDDVLSFIPLWAAHEARVLQRRMRLAMVLMGAALVLTVATIISSVVADREPQLVEAQVVFDDSVELPLEEVCELEFSPIPVRILGPDELDRTQNTVQMEIVDCGGERRWITVLWSQVRALVYS